MNFSSNLVTEVVYMLVLLILKRNSLIIILTSFVLGYRKAYVQSISQLKHRIEKEYHKWAESQTKQYI